MEVCLTCAYQVARKEGTHNSNKDTVGEVLQYVRAELGDVQLHAALQAIHRSFQGLDTDHSTVEGQLITRLFHRLRCVLLLLTILEADSIQYGVHTPKANYIAKIVVSFCRSQAIRRGGPIDDYYMISWHNFSHLLLGGMALPTEECPERKDLLHLILMCEVCAWVIDELEFIGKEKCARSLEEYWREADVTVLVEILDYAQFPEMMPEEHSS
jgi:hypothetical protein